MASKKQIRERLEQIKRDATSAAMNSRSDRQRDLANLAEEAASLGLDLLEGGK